MRDLGSFYITAQERLKFTARSIVDDATARLLTFAIEAGKAQKLLELRRALGLKQ